MRCERVSRNDLVSADRAHAMRCSALAPEAVSRGVAEGRDRGGSARSRQTTSFILLAVASLVGAFGLSGCDEDIQYKYDDGFCDSSGGWYPSDSGYISLAVGSASALVASSAQNWLSIHESNCCVVNRYPRWHGDVVGHNMPELDQYFEGKRSKHLVEVNVYGTDPGGSKHYVASYRYDACRQLITKFEKLERTK